MANFFYVISIDDECYIYRIIHELFYQSKRKSLSDVMETTNTDKLWNKPKITVFVWIDTLVMSGEYWSVINCGLLMNVHNKTIFFTTHAFLRQWQWKTIERNISSLQGRIQDFKLGGGTLKKIAQSGGRREHFWGISCEKSRFYAKKIIFFPI